MAATTRGHIERRPSYVGIGFYRPLGSLVLAPPVRPGRSDQPVFIMHGTPGSRLEPYLGRRALTELGVRLISFDRPGYGGSDRREFRAVSDVASDVVTIADDLGLGQFAVLGWSAGGFIFAYWGVVYIGHNGRDHGRRLTRVGKVVAG